MNEQTLINQVLRILNSNYSNIYVIDIPGDVVYIFDFNLANKLIVKEKTTYTDFIDIVPKFVHKDDISEYFSLLSLNALEAQAKKGNSETKIKYRKLCDAGEYRWHQNIINYLPFEGHKLIFMMSEDINDRLADVEENTLKLEDTVKSYKNKLSKENASIAEALDKVNEILSNTSSGNRDSRNAITSIFNKVSADNPELTRALRDRMTNADTFERYSILIVDDSSIIRNSLKRIFEKDYEIVMAKNGFEAIDLLKTSIESKKIVGVLLDLMMPECDGFAVLDFMKANNLLEYLPVAIISGDETLATRKRVYEYDIADMLEKPFNTITIRKRIDKIIRLNQTSNDLQAIINKQTAAISKIDTKRVDILESIMKTIANNIRSSKESIKLQKWVRIVAIYLADQYPQYKINNTMIDNIINVCPLYNIGAITIGENTVITNKVIVEEIKNGLAIASLIINDQDELKVAQNIIKFNCELFDGSGYPNGVKGNAIPIESQIVTILVRLKEYARNRNFATAMRLLEENESNKYNQDVLDSVKAVRQELKSIEE